MKPKAKKQPTSQIGVILMQDGAKSVIRDKGTQPGFWAYETSGVLASIVMRYLEQKPLNRGQIRIMKAYLAQWVDAPTWRGGDELEQLRAQVKRIETEAQLHAAINAATDLGMDPL